MSSEQEITTEQVSAELQEAKELTQGFSLEEVKSGEWFLRLLAMVVRGYGQNSSTIWKAHPTLLREDIVEKLVNNAAKKVGVAGGITGVAFTGEEVLLLGSGGLALPLFVGAMGAEMVYLARVQMRLILDIASLYGVQLDPDNPQDMLLIFGYALGLPPTEVLSTLAEHSARTVTKNTIRAYIGRTTIKAIQEYSRSIGLKILQRTITKYAVPGVSAVMGSSYNYAATKTIGKIAQAHFKNRGAAAKELQGILAAENAYALIFAAAAVYMAQVDGAITDKEMELYSNILSHLSLDETSNEEFEQLSSNETALLNAMASIEDQALCMDLLEMAVLMAAYDGEISQPEIEFLNAAAKQFGCSVDMDALYRRAKKYRIDLNLSMLERTNNAVNWVSEVATDGVIGTAAALKNITVSSVGWLKDSLAGLWVEQDSGEEK